MELILITQNYPYGNGEEFLENEIKKLSEKFIRIHLLCLSRDKILTKITPENVFVTRIDNKNVENKVFSALKIISLKTFKELDYVKNSLKLKVDKNIINKIFLYYYYEKELLRKFMNLCTKDTILCSCGFGPGVYAVGNFKFPCFEKIALLSEKDVMNENYIPFRKETFKNLDKILFSEEKIKDNFIRITEEKNILDKTEFDFFDIDKYFTKNF